jgi:twinkle protein|tara:strand:- start:1552 stop:3204 length:1653 start_codon:yes stop_codon:yes gene_type:complete
MAFIEYHLPCEECGSSDAVSLNEDGSGYCFSCSGYFKNYKEEPTMKLVSHQSSNNLQSPNNEHGAVYGALTDRKISKDTAQKYGVKVVHDSAGNVIQHLYPLFNLNEQAALKIRYVKDKNFSFRGTPEGTGLFGEQLFKGGKYITITEGECDAMAGFELFGSKYDVVSIKRGCQGAVKDVKESLEFLEQYENIIICFDNDKAGKEASQKVAQLFSPSKSKIMTLPNGFKDANEMLKENKHAQFVKAFWDAKTYTPSGVINVSDKREEFHKREKKPSIPYPWEGLNDKLVGLRGGELVTLTGGTGLGKSSVTRELEHHLIKNTTDNIGVIALEEDWRRTIDGILSIEANNRLYIDHIREEYSPEQLDKFFDILYDGENKNRVWVHAHFGTNDIEEIFSKIRFMIIGCECKWVVLDHLHMLVSAVHDGDERRAIDSIMSRLRSIVEETGVGMILVSHLRRVEGNKGHENGVEVGLSHLRGSQSIAQLSDCVIALERNQQSDSASESNTTKIRVLKSRYTGEVGTATRLLYDRETGRLNEVIGEEDTETNDDF